MKLYIMTYRVSVAGELEEHGIAKIIAKDEATAEKMLTDYLLMPWPKGEMEFNFSSEEVVVAKSTVLSVVAEEY